MRAGLEIRISEPGAISDLLLQEAMPGLCFYTQFSV